jgi:hypothetical protein
MGAALGRKRGRQTDAVTSSGDWDLRLMWQGVRVTKD